MESNYFVGFPPPPTVPPTIGYEQKFEVSTIPIGVVDSKLSQKTPITILQEICSKKGLTPQYELLSSEGAVSFFCSFNVCSLHWSSCRILVYL